MGLLFNSGPSGPDNHLSWQREWSVAIDPVGTEPPVTGMGPAIRSAQRSGRAYERLCRLQWFPLRRSTRNPQGFGSADPICDFACDLAHRPIPGSRFAAPCMARGNAEAPTSTRGATGFGGPSNRSQVVAQSFQQSLRESRCGAPAPPIYAQMSIRLSCLTGELRYGGRGRC